MNENDPFPSDILSEAPIRTVTELTRDIKSVLEGRFSGVWVEGELFTFKRHASGHLYFTLKDAGAQLASVMFRSSASRLPFSPSEGMRVQCRGRVTVYEPQGKYQLLVEAMRPAGQGALLAALERLKTSLQAEGLFDPARKIPLPPLPRRVGIVTSPSGAAIRDMLRILHDRFPVQVLLYPAAVQGAGAAREIAEGIRTLDTNREVDVIIIGRGGGSLEDLWAFNEEIVVRAVAACQTPIVSAVGHEVDFLLTDLAADMRAPTPTGAAEMVVPKWLDLKATLDFVEARMVRAWTRRAERQRLRLKASVARLTRPDRLLDKPNLQLEDQIRRLQAGMQRQLTTKQRRLERQSNRLGGLHPAKRLSWDRRRFESATSSLQPAIRRILDTARAQHNSVDSKLHLLGPEQVLSRGYAIVRQAQNGDVVRSWKNLRRGAEIRVMLAQGAATAVVNQRAASFAALLESPVRPTLPEPEQGLLWDVSPIDTSPAAPSQRENED